MTDFNQEWVSIGAVIALAVSFLPLLKFPHDLISSKRQFKVRHLELLHRSFNEPENPAMKLVVEQQFRSLFKCKANFDEISELLAAEKVTKAIEHYRDGYRYLEFEDGKFRLISKFQQPKKRIRAFVCRPIRNIVLYFLFAFPAGFLGIFSYSLIMASFPLETDDHIITLFIGIVSATFSAAFTIIAFFSITDTHNIKHAEQFLAVYDENYETSIDLNLWQNVKRFCVRILAKKEKAAEASF